MGLFSTKRRPSFKAGRLRLESLEPRLLLDGAAGHDPDGHTEGAVIIPFGESWTLIHPYEDEPYHLEAQSPYFAETGTDDHYVWQDQITSTPDVIDVFYDFRAQGMYANHITSSQIVMAEQGLEMWSDTTGGRLNFTRNTTAPKSRVINIGTGDLAALGYTSGPGGTLAVGGGVFSNNGDSYTITSGVAWLDFAENWDVVLGNGNVAGGFDYFTVVTHEIGHALGLGHIDYMPGADIMDGVYPGEMTGPSANDVTHINVLYGADTPGIRVTSSLGLITSEGGSSDSFSVVLNSAPLADVTIDLHSSDESEGTLSTTRLVFTPANWSVAQTVTVTGVDDHVVDGVVEYLIVTDPAVSADPAYHGLDPEDVLAFNLDDDVPATGPSLRTGVVSGVSNAGWTTVTLDRTYTSMVVVTTANYDNSSNPLVTRVRNAAGSSFEIRVDRTDGSSAQVAPVSVHYLVVEEGVYNLAEHGVKMEAQKFLSTSTDYASNFAGAARSYANAYSIPVVLGQVMTYNDPAFSAFWSRGPGRTSAPTSSSLYVGKHVGEDQNRARANEMIGYVVIDEGAGTIGGTGYQAALGADNIRGMDNSPPHTYALSGLTSAGVAVASLSGMDGNDGGWAVLYGSGAVSSTSLKLSIDEDQARDSERDHTHEQVAYIVFEGSTGPANQLPQAVNDVATTDEDVPIDINVLANDSDPDGDPLSVTSVNQVIGGTVVNHGNGTVTFAPVANFNGTATFSYTIGNGRGGTATAGVTVVVAPVNDPPVANDDFATTDEKTSVVINVLANDSDPDGDTLSVSSITQGASGTVVVNGNGTVAYTPAPGFTGIDTFTYRANDGTADSAAATVSITVRAITAGPQARSGVISGVTNAGWTTVTLDRAYASMVVIITPNYGGDSLPLVPRVRNASGNQFEVRVDRTDGLSAPVTPVSVHYMVVEEGVYTVAEHGVKMEAVKFISTVTDHNDSWDGQTRSYSNSYSNPVIVGQVMTYNDSDFSVFWTRGSRRQDVPTSSVLFVGKHVGEDSNTIRADETIGYVVIEAGSGTMGGATPYEAGLGPSIVKGVHDKPPYTYTLSGLSSAGAAVVSSAGMEGRDGGWAILYGADAVTVNGLKLAADEDQASDSERKHAAEQMAYIVFATPTAPSMVPSVADRFVEILLVLPPGQLESIAPDLQSALKKFNHLPRRDVSAVSELLSGQITVDQMPSPSRNAIASLDKALAKAVAAWTESHRVEQFLPDELVESLAISWLRRASPS